MGLCEVADCLKATRPGRRMCETHAKRLQRGTPMGAPVDESKGPRSLRETFLEAVHRYANADSDVEFERAEWRLMDAGRRYFRTAVGRPPKVPTGDVIRAWQELHSVRAVAKRLGVHRRSIQRALTRAGLRRKAEPKGTRNT